MSAGQASAWKVEVAEGSRILLVEVMTFWNLTSTLGLCVRWLGGWCGCGFRCSHWRRAVELGRGQSMVLKEGAGKQ